MKQYKFNLLFYLCILLSLYVNFIVLYAYVQFPIHTNISANSVNKHLYLLINCVLFSLPYFLFKGRRHILWFFLYLLLLDAALLVANNAYYRYYNSIIPIFSYLELGNMFELRSEIPSYLKVTDFIYLLPTAGVIAAYFLFFRRRLVQVSRKYRLVTSTVLLGASLAVFGASMVSARLKHISLDQKYRIAQGNQCEFLAYFGFFPLWTYQLASAWLVDNSPLTVSETEHIESYLNRPPTLGSALSSAGKNLVLIVVESLSTWVTQYEDGAAMPFLASLQQDSTVVFVPHVLPQTMHGRSSDAQVMYNTVLLPVRNGTVCSMYNKQYYPALPEALEMQRDGTSFTMIGHKPSIWNQQLMNEVYHIDTLYAIEDLRQDDMVSIAISDKSLLCQAADLIMATPLPLYAQIITYTSHDAAFFADAPSVLDFPADMPEHVRNYIKVCSYVDEAIALFIERLKQDGLYDRSVVVIIGDHEGVHAADARPYDTGAVDRLEQDDCTFIPLYILNSGRSFTQTAGQVIGQVDLYPTLLDLMGCGAYDWQGLGTSIFATKPPTFAISKDLRVVGDTTGCTPEEIRHRTKAWSISDLIIRKKYFEAAKNRQ